MYARPGEASAAKGASSQFCGLSFIPGIHKVERGPTTGGPLTTTCAHE